MHETLQFDGLVAHSDYDALPEASPSAPVIVAVRFERAVEVVEETVSALRSLRAEVAASGAMLVLVADTKDEILIAALKQTILQLDRSGDVRLLDDASHLDIAQSANRVAEFASAERRDIIFLRPDFKLTRHGIAELMAVAKLDPLIAMVGPSDQIPNRFLPRYSFVPEMDDRCVLIKSMVAKEFGPFDGSFKTGRYVLLDMLMRCNLRGYRAVVANQVSASRRFLKRSPSHLRLSRLDRILFQRRHPEFDSIWRRHMVSSDHRARQVVRSLVETEHRLRLLLDCRVLGEFYNGTFEHICRLIESVARGFAHRFDIGILCEEGAFEFHGLDAIPGLRRVDLREALEKPAAIAFRMNQPDRECLATIARLGAVTGALMLDTIALDCQHLDDAQFDTVWQSAADMLDLIGFNSSFSRDQFGRRFAVRHDVVQFISRCSTDPRDYPGRPAVANSRSLLIVGNEYPHKHVREMVRALGDADIEQPIVVFGMQLDGVGVVASYPSGSLAPEAVDRLYSEAAVMIFPSHYEGFGLPIMHALSGEVPVIARDLPSAREIGSRTPHGRNLYLCRSTEEMVRLASHPLRWQADETPLVVDRDWDAAARELVSAIEKALSRFSYDICRKHQTQTEIWSQAVDAGDDQSITRLKAGLDMAGRASLALSNKLRVAEQRSIDLASLRDQANTRAQSAETQLADTRRSALNTEVRLITMAARLPSGTIDGSSRDRWRDRWSTYAWPDRLAFWALRTRSLSDETSQNPGIEFSRIKLDSDEENLQYLKRQLILRLLSVEVGVRVQLRIRGNEFDRLEPAILSAVISSLFSSAGCDMYRLRRNRSYVQATAIKGNTFLPILSVEDDDLFVRSCYRILFGRDVREVELARHLNEIDRGTLRKDILSDLLDSVERWSWIQTRSTEAFARGRVPTVCQQDRDRRSDRPPQ